MVDKLDAKNLELYCYSGQYKKANRLSDRLIGKAADAFSRGGRYREYSLRTLMDAARVVIYGFAAIALDSVEVRKKKNTLHQILGCVESELAVDINEFFSLRERTKYFGGDFTYNAGTRKEWLKNLMLIFGDAHLEALDEMSCLTSLESIWGNVYFSRCVDLSGLRLKHIGGDLHGEKLATAKGLEHLNFVGGTIYFQDCRFGTLDEFRSIVII